MVPPNASTTNQSGRATGVSGRGGGNSDSDSTGTEGRRARGGSARGRGRGRDNSTGRSTSSGSTGSGKHGRIPSSEDIRGDGAPAEGHVDSPREPSKHISRERLRNTKDARRPNASGGEIKNTIRLNTVQIELLTRTWESTSGLFAERMDSIDYEQIATKLNTMHTTEHGTPPKPNTFASVKKYFHNHYKR